MSRNLVHHAKDFHVSQNFLTSTALIRRIVGLAKLEAHDHVVEIGAGKGHLTKQLLSRCKMVTAVEIDRRLYERLAETYSDTAKLRPFCGDFLSWPLPKTTFKVFANIPFNQTTNILRKLTECPALQEAWLVMEKGAAKRFMGSSRKSLASLLLKPFFELSIRYHFRREDFHPAPKVDCVLLQLKRKALPDVSPADFGAYRRFLTQCFAGRQNGIHQLLTHKQISTALKREGLSCDRPSANMLYVQWLCLFRCYQKFHK